MTFSERYSETITGDNSLSLFSFDYNDIMHSESGATEEAMVKHVTASRLLDDPSTDTISILDIGFGLGYNTLVAMEQITKSHHVTSLSIHALEMDQELGRYISEKKLHGSSPCAGLLYQMLEAGTAEGTISETEINISIYWGDARKKIQSVDEVFHAVFHDAYTPSKNPELWSVDFFKQVKTLMMTNSFLTTYSSAPQVRGALLDTGFFIAASPSTGKKHQGTVASPSPFLGSIPLKEIKEFRKNRKTTPYRDAGLNLTGAAILENRKREMERLRSGN